MKHQYHVNILTGKSLIYFRIDQSIMINVNNSNVIKHVLNIFFFCKIFILNFGHEL